MEKNTEDSEVVYSNQKIKSNVDKLENHVLLKGNNYSYNDFEIIKELGHGAYAKVYLARYKIDNKEYALKTISRHSILKEGKLYQVFFETDLLLMLNNFFIAKIHGAFEEGNKMFIVMDYYKNGDLFDLIAVNSKCIIFICYII